ncbi:MAG: hypothetical protein BWX70_02723 [Verrucomicrobia bacterium ADurb.Bin070]|nr:MAG: hypothetical protein BWX70_02723 [Verrucomicrobia bacterium ADurb.Bin070]
MRQTSRGGAAARSYSAQPVPLPDDTNRHPPWMIGSAAFMSHSVRHGICHNRRPVAASAPTTAWPAKKASASVSPARNGTGDAYPGCPAGLSHTVAPVCASSTVPASPRLITSRPPATSGDPAYRQVFFQSPSRHGHGAKARDQSTRPSRASRQKRSPPLLNVYTRPSATAGVDEGPPSYESGCSSQG